MEKVVLFFLAKQGDLARRLLGARREQQGWKASETPTLRDGTPEGMGQAWGSELSLSRDDCGSDRGLRSMYCSIGGEIAELMRFLQLNGKSFDRLDLLIGDQVYLLSFLVFCSVMF